MAAVVPLITWRPAVDDAYKARGAPLGEVFDAVLRTYWSAPGVSDSRKATARRCRELAASLPDHPTPADVWGWYESLRAMFPSEATAHLHVKTLRAVYRFGADLGVSSGNPAALVQVRRPTPRVTPIENIGALWPLFLDACRDERERGFLAVLRCLGGRRGEALALTAADVNTYADPWCVEITHQRPDPNSWQVRPRTKSESGQREVPVAPDLQPFLAAVLDLGPARVRVGRGGQELQEVPFLFPFREHDLSNPYRTGLLDRLRAIAPDAFPDGKAWHCFRDTMALEMRRAGRSFSEIAEAIGHGSERTTREHYLGKFGRRVPVAAMMAAAQYRASGAAPPIVRGAAAGMVPSGAPRSGAPTAPTVSAPEPVVSPAVPAKRKRNTTCQTPSCVANPTAAVSPAPPVSGPVQRSLPRTLTPAVVSPRRRRS